MLQGTKLKTLHELIESSSRDELIWINGYLAGLVASEKLNALQASINGNGNSAAVVEPKPVAVKKISLVFGTETGNSKKLATQFAGVAKKKGINAKVTALDQYKLPELSKEEYFFAVISTHGEGEPPASAKKFYDHVLQSHLTLPNLKYSILALGDTSYPLFCKAGEDVDLQLEKFGAKRIAPLVKCDVDFEEDATAWFEKVLKALEQQTTVPAAVDTVAPKSGSASKGKKYYNGTVTTNINLNDRGSSKETFHIEISTDEAVEYEPGDAIGVIPHNRKEIVERIISLTGIAGHITIETPKASGTVRELLTSQLNICYLLGATIKKYAEITKQDIPDTRMDLVDLLRIYPVKDANQFEEVLKLLSPIAPRLYSVSSSPNAHTNEIHITVSKNSFRVEEEQRFGLCSEFLGDMQVNSEVTFYVHKNRAFKLPGEEKDVIMIGPGTGIAPFRSFLAERDATGASGKNWLFFGEQKFQTDFLYQAELQNFYQTGVLNKLHVAFSRDQAYKIYVQHRLLEQATDVWNWLQGGAYLYVCGAKDPMSKDVDYALTQIIERKGGKTSAEAVQYLEQLKEEGRYQKDVY